MPHRQRSNRATPATYIHYGKPEEIELVKVVYGKGKRGVRDETYVERLKGVSTDSRTAKDTSPVKAHEKGGAIHPNGCDRQRGVRRLWYRGGVGLCEKDYELRWDVSPWLDDLLEDPPRGKE